MRMWYLEMKTHNWVIDRLVKVPIRYEHRLVLPFGSLQARAPIGTVFGFFGYSHEVHDLLSTLSHSTRAFIVNAEGLRGFVKLSIVSVLRSAELSGDLIKATRFMYVDIESVKKILE